MAIKILKEGIKLTPLVIKYFGSCDFCKTGIEAGAEDALANDHIVSPAIPIRGKYYYNIEVRCPNENCSKLITCRPKEIL